MTNQDNARKTIRDQMARKGLTQADLVRATGLDKSTVSDLIAGNRWPRSTTLVKLDRALGWSPGTIEGISRGDVDPAEVGGVSARQQDAHDGVLLDVGEALDGLTDVQRDEALTAAKLRMLEVAREIRRQMGDQ